MSSVDTHKHSFAPKSADDERHPRRACNCGRVEVYRPNSSRGRGSRGITWGWREAMTDAERANLKPASPRSWWAKKRDGRVMRVLANDSDTEPSHPDGGYAHMGCRCSGCADAAPSPLPPRKLDPIQAVRSPAGFRLMRPGARYAVRPEGDARPGAWLPDGEALSLGWTDIYPENEALALLPFLRARATAGCKARAPTTPDGKLIASACKKLGITATALGKQIVVDAAVLSRARTGELPAKYREAIKELLATTRSAR